MMLRFAILRIKLVRMILGEKEIEFEIRISCFLIEISRFTRLHISQRSFRNFWAVPANARYVSHPFLFHTEPYVSPEHSWPHCI